MRSFSRIGRTAQRLLFIVCVSLSCAVVASAYTIVMRDGRRVQIPDRFEVTKTTLTYEVSPGFQVTLQISSINIPATERANREQAGSLMNRAASPSQINLSPVKRLGDSSGDSQSSVRRSITNRDLQVYAKIRQDSERAYARRLKELGLPSLAESNRRREDESRKIQGELAETRQTEAGTESYWRTRASELRTDIAATDAEIAYVRARLDEVNAAWNTSSFSIVNSGYPIGFGSPFNGGFRGRRHFSNIGQGVFMTTGTPFGGTVVGGPFGNLYPRGRIRNTPFLTAPYLTPFSNGTGFGLPYQGYDIGYERSSLITRLDELVGRRAGLSVRWRELEEQARRAGAMPGWLRP